MIGPKNLQHFLSQSDAGLKPITTWSFAFSRAFRSLGSFFFLTLISHWLLKVFYFLLIGRCDYFRFGFTTLYRKALYLTTYYLHLLTRVTGFSVKLFIVLCAKMIQRAIVAKRTPLCVDDYLSWFILITVPFRNIIKALHVASVCSSAQDKTSAD